MLTFTASAPFFECTCPLLGLVYYLYSVSQKDKRNPLFTHLSFIILCFWRLFFKEVSSSRRWERIAVIKISPQNIYYTLYAQKAPNIFVILHSLKTHPPSPSTPLPPPHPQQPSSTKKKIITPHSLSLSLSLLQFFYFGFLFFCFCFFWGFLKRQGRRRYADKMRDAKGRQTLAGRVVLGSLVVVVAALFLARILFAGNRDVTPDTEKLTRSRFAFETSDGKNAPTAPRHEFKVVTDIHYDGGPYTTAKGSALIKLKAVLREMNTEGYHHAKRRNSVTEVPITAAPRGQPQSSPFLAILGDAKDENPIEPTQAAVRKNLEDVSSLVHNDWGGDVHWVVGNHDVDRLFKSEWRSIVNHGRSNAPKRSYYSQLVGDSYQNRRRHMYLIVLDAGFFSDGVEWGCLSCNDENEHRGWDHSYVPSTERDWLVTTLNTIREEQGVAVVLSHARLDLPHSDREAKLTVRNAAEVRKIISLDKGLTVPLVLHGHDHKAGHSPQTLDGVLYYTVPALVDAGLPSLPWLSVYVSAAPPCYVSIRGHGPATNFEHPYQCLRTPAPAQPSPEPLDDSNKNKNPVALEPAAVAIEPATVAEEKEVKK